jgi:hypothetical protein
MLHVGAAMAHHLSAEVETWYWIKANRDFLLGPFSLYEVSKVARQPDKPRRFTYATELIALDLLLVPTPKSPFVDKRWEFLLHELLNLGDGFV